MIDATDTEALPLKRDLQRFGMRQPACRALVDAQYGIGGLFAVAVWSELGDCQRFSRSEQAVRHTGLDVTVDASDRRRAGGYLSRQGPETLRWALYEAAKNSSHQRSPDHAYYERVKAVTAARSPRSPSPAVHATLLPHSAQLRSRPRVRHPDLTLPAGAGAGRPLDIRVNRDQLPQPACPPALVLDGLRTMTRSRSHQGDTQSRLLSPTTRSSSSTQVTLGAPTPPRAGPKQVNTATASREVPTSHGQTPH